MRGCAKSRFRLHSWSKQLRHSHRAVTRLTDEGGTTGKYTSLIHPVAGPLSCTTWWYLISLTAPEASPLTRVPPPTNDFHLRPPVYGGQTDADLLREIRRANYAPAPPRDCESRLKLTRSARKLSATFDVYRIHWSCRFNRPKSLGLNQWSYQIFFQSLLFPPFL